MTRRPACSWWLMALVAMLLNPRLALSDGDPAQGINNTELFAAFGLRQPEVEVVAPDLDTVSLNGEKIRLEDFSGQLILLNFWATFCSPCLKEMPSMQMLWKQYRDQGFTVLAVAVEPGRESAIRRFISRLKLEFPIAIDADERAGEDYGVGYLPLSYLIKDRRILAMASGERDWSSPVARQIIESLLRQ